MVDISAYRKIKAELNELGVTLVAVSKTKPAEDILTLYDEGQRDFGENRVQELVDKQQILPSDIRWHMIGHLQTNKVKYIAPFVHLIHAVDSEKLLKEIDKQGAKHSKHLSVLLQARIASEETKHGMEFEAITSLSNLATSGNVYKNVDVKGLMGMATFTDDETKIKAEFNSLGQLYQGMKNDHISICSMGMSGDYKVAIAAGSNMVRIGSAIFGARN